MGFRVWGVGGSSKLRGLCLGVPERGMALNSSEGDPLSRATKSDPSFWEFQCKDWPAKGFT